MATTMGKYANIKVSCGNETLGCTWKGLFKDLDEHSSTCDKDLLRNAIISIQRLEARLEIKDRETFYLKNDFALKIDHISKERKVKIKDEFEKFENLAVRINDGTEELKKHTDKEVDALKEEMKKMKEGMDELKEKNKEVSDELKAEMKKMKDEMGEDIKKLKKENEEMKKENESLRKKLEDSAGNKVSASKDIILTTTVTTSPESSVRPILQNPAVRIPITKTYLDLVNSDGPLGRVVIKLFTDLAPLNCAKFIKLFTHENGLGYRGSELTSIGSDYCGMYDSDLVYPGSSSEFPRELTTPTENKSAKHDRSRLVSLRSSGGFTKAAFKLMFIPHSFYNNNSVIIGEATEETWHVVEKTKKVEAREVVKISDCGILE